MWRSDDVYFVSPLVPLRLRNLLLLGWIARHFVSWFEFLFLANGSNQSLWG